MGEGERVFFFSGSLFEHAQFGADWHMHAMLFKVFRQTDQMMKQSI